MSRDQPSDAREEQVVVTKDADLLAAVNVLSERVVSLTERLTVSVQQARRTRILSIAVIVMILGGFIIGYDYARRISDNVEANQATQVQQCENANSVRNANILLWDQITGLSIENPDSTPEQRAAFIALQEWIKGLYRPRDCADLDKVYDNPPPPDFAKIMGGMTNDE